MLAIAPREIRVDLVPAFRFRLPARDASPDPNPPWLAERAAAGRSILAMRPARGNVTNADHRPEPRALPPHAELSGAAADHSRRVEDPRGGARGEQRRARQQRDVFLDAGPRRHPHRRARHFGERGTPIDQYPLEYCIVPGICIDLRHIAPKAEITPA